MLNKPKRPALHLQLINSFAKENMIKKIGHTGTLDPLAIRAFISSNWWWHKINSIYKT
nr:hypothetical protein [Mycoplasmopsis bovis]